MSQQVAEFMLRKKNLPAHQKEKFLRMHDQESLNYIVPPKRKNVFFHFIGSLSYSSSQLKTNCTIIIVIIITGASIPDLSMNKISKPKNYKLGLTAKMHLYFTDSTYQKATTFSDLLKASR